MAIKQRLMASTVEKKNVRKLKNGHRLVFSAQLDYRVFFTRKSILGVPDFISNRKLRWGFRPAAAGERQQPELWGILL